MSLRIVCERLVENAPRFQYICVESMMGVGSSSGTLTMLIVHEGALVMESVLTVKVT